MKKLAPLLGVALAGCGVSAVPPPRAGYVPVPSAAGAPMPANLAAIQGASANGLIARFGRPQLDVSEGTARKLQFAGPICVLDTYLYPKGRGEAVVTHVDARQRDGSPIDEASCVAALSGSKR